MSAIINQDKMCMIIIQTVQRVPLEVIQDVVCWIICLKIKIIIKNNIPLQPILSPFYPQSALPQTFNPFLLTSLPSPVLTYWCGQTTGKQTQPLTGCWSIQATQNGISLIAKSHKINHVARTLIRATEVSIRIKPISLVPQHHSFWSDSPGWKPFPRQLYQ